MTALEPRSGAPHTRFRRLLVVLDISSPTLDALDELAALASRLEADIQGLFVEDSDLLDLAGYRVVTTFPTRSPLVLDATTIERTLRRHVAMVRQAVEAAALHCRVPVAFEVRRGRTSLELSRAAGTDDLLVVSRRASGFARFKAPPDPSSVRPGPVAQHVIRETQQSVFILGEEGSLKGPLYTAFDGTPSATLALEFAASVAARSEDRPLVVLLITADTGDAEVLKRKAQVVLSRYGVPSSYQIVTDEGVEALCASLATRANGVLVLGDHQDLHQGSGVHDVLELVGCSVLLLR